MGSSKIMINQFKSIQNYKKFIDYMWSNDTLGRTFATTKREYIKSSFVWLNRHFNEIDKDEQNKALIELRFLRELLFNNGKR
jgi:hypothetical protein